MSLWMIRAGRFGQQEAVAIEQNVVTIGWDELPDLSSIKTRAELQKLYSEVYPEYKKPKMANQVGQIWRFIHDIKIGDLVALSLKTQSIVKFGQVQSNYEFKHLADNVNHIRHVKWIKDISRSSIDQDLLYSLGAIMTVCEISRNNAETRVKQMLEKGIIVPPSDEEGTEQDIDIETIAKDQITKHISRVFKGHELARLTEAILKAQGYLTRLSTPGPDGGVDILASGGPLGFDHPKICVQVKSTSSQVDVKVLRELMGVMSKVKADQGLLVSWSGFNNNVIKEAQDNFFTIRLWDSGYVIEAIFMYYDKFSDELKAELQLKRIWALVLEE